MSMIKSYAAKEAGGELEVYEYDPGELRPQDVEVQVDYCGICHSDLSMIDNEWGFSQYPLVAGHEHWGPQAVKAAAQTMRANPAFDTEKAIQELGTGEALISFLDAKGSPSVVERAMVIAPCSRMGPVTEDERNGLINHSPVYGKYEDEVDRESAYEMLQKGFQASTEQQNNPPAKGKEVAVDDGILGGLKDILFGTTGPRGGKKDGVVQTMAKSAARQVTNQIVRGMLGSLLGGRRR